MSTNLLQNRSIPLKIPPFSPPEEYGPDNNAISKIKEGKEAVMWIRIDHMRIRIHKFGQCGSGSGPDPGQKNHQVYFEPSFKS